MIELAGTEGRTYAVMGLGASGIATAAALARAGAHVLAWDDDAGRRDAATRQGVALTDLGAADLAEAEALVLSPGIPHTYPAPHPIATRARAAGIPIICDIELLLRADAAPRVIGITGTNGKSTVTALVGHILKTAGVPCSVGGNLGPAALGLDRQGANGAYVLELSSYQIERIETAGFDVTVLINHLRQRAGGDVRIRRGDDLARGHARVRVLQLRPLRCTERVSRGGRPGRGRRGWSRRRGACGRRRDRACERCGGRLGQPRRPRASRGRRGDDLQPVRALGGKPEPHGRLLGTRAAPSSASKGRPVPPPGGIHLQFRTSAALGAGYYSSHPDRYGFRDPYRYIGTQRAQNICQSGGDEPPASRGGRGSDFNGDGSADIVSYEAWNGGALYVGTSTGTAFGWARWAEGLGAPAYLGAGDVYR